MIMILMKTKQSDRLVTRDAVLFIFILYIFTLI